MIRLISLGWLVRSGGRRCRSGGISTAELGALVKSIGATDIGKKQLARIVKRLDEDKSGEVSFDEFIGWWRDFGLKRAFAKCDADSSGFLGLNEFRALLCDIGLNLPPAEVSEAIATIDPTPLSTASIAQARSPPGVRTRWGLGPPGFLLRMRTLTALHGSPPPPLAGARGSAGVGRASGAQGTARRGGLPLRAGPRAEREARRVACEGRGMPIGGLSNSGRADEIESATRSHARPPQLQASAAFLFLMILQRF